jgi:cytochrome d ubiquinol oxidase subunit II
VGIFNVLFLMMHGSLFIAVKSPLQEHKERAAKWAYGLFFAMIVFSAVVIGSTFAVRPNILANYHTLPILAIMPIAATFGAIGIPLSLRKNSYGGALYSSSIMIAFMILTLFCGLYPTLLPALGNDALNMTIFNTAVSSWNLALVAGLNIFGMIIVVFYAIYIHKVFKGTVDLNDIDHSY